MKKHAKSNYPRHAIGRLFLRLALFSVVYGLLLIFFDVVLNAYTGNALESWFGSSWLFRVFFGSWPTLALFFYFFCLGVICFYEQYRTAKQVTMISREIVRLPDLRLDVGDLPADLEAVERDLVEVKLTLERNAQQAKEAEQRKNDLIVYLAHDLKTPLTSVIGYLTLLDEAPELPMEQRAKYTAITLEKAYRLEQLINEFFEITRFSLQNIVLEHNRIDLALMLRQLLDEFYPLLAQKDLALCTRIEPELHIVADADKLARVFDNVLRNAVNYSYAGTEIEVRAAEQDGRLSVAIRNQGDEIPADKLERVFEKFFRLDNARGSAAGGAGLGLAIARHIVELHGGVIRVESCREYTEFCIELPTQL